jgi:C-methyltransferase C-terminal domain/Putative zinc binding domain/Methyltransferase domain
MDYVNGLKKLDKCICCGGDELELILDLGRQPLANSFKDAADAKEDVYPLAVNHCGDCHHLQLTHAVDPQIMFKNYLYVSGTSRTMQDYFRWFAQFALECHPSAQSVFEIGCNDGSQLNYFKAMGLKTYGIDPAENIHPISNREHEVKCDFFEHEHVDWVRDVVKPDIIYLQNVFAHQDRPLDMLWNISQSMGPNTILMIQNSQSDMVINNEFDTIYHEHRSFFSRNSMRALCDMAMLHVVDVFTGTIHGGSDIFVIKKYNGKPARISGIIAREAQMGLHDVETYRAWAKRAQRTVDDLAMVLDGQRKAHNRLIVGYGAPAKGNTLLNFGQIDMDFIIDDNPLKQGKFTPGMGIPVVPPQHLDQFVGRDICFVPLAWNFFDEIVGRIRDRRDNKGDAFVRYFPTIRVV